MLYSVEVIEVVARHCRYTVEADNDDEAVAMATAGETIQEELVRTQGVISREALPGTIQGE